MAPQPIENKLKNNVLVAQAALVGDKHKFISALLSPNFVALEEWAKSTASRRIARRIGGRQPRDGPLWRDCPRGEWRAGEF